MGAIFCPKRRRRRCQPAAVAFSLVAAFSSGCATLVVGTHQDVLFRSDPPGATASVPGAGSVETPGRLSINRLDPGSVTFSTEGHRAVSVEIGRDVHPMVLANVFCLILPGLVADFLLGGAYRLDEEVFVRLEKLPRDPISEGAGSWPEGTPRAR